MKGFEFYSQFPRFLDYDLSRWREKLTKNVSNVSYKLAFLQDDLTCIFCCIECDSRVSLSDHLETNHTKQSVRYWIKYYLDKPQHELEYETRFTRYGELKQ